MSMNANKETLSGNADTSYPDADTEVTLFEYTLF